MEPILETGRRARWVSEKCRTALSLAKGECGGSYGDAVLILTAALSAMAAEAWPGVIGIDRRRFIELLVRFAPDRALVTRVSIPVLCEELLMSGQTLELTAISKQVLEPSSLVVVGEDIDQSEELVLSTVGSIETAFLRKFSYASVLYTEVRSGYVHECHPSERATSQPMTHKTDVAVSYSNLLIEIEDRVRRQIHFHLEWLGETALEIARRLDEYHVGFVRPEKWWVDGGEG